LNIKKVDKVLMDLGVSSPQLLQPDRGFSFIREGPLDMRMDQDSDLTAKEIVNTYAAEDIANILYEYGDERKSRKIAKAIVQKRKLRKHETTQDLVKTIEEVFQGHFKRYRIHPATRTFQALRIYVNDELGALKETLDKVENYLNDNARLVVISFHSLEDRIVKNNFRDNKKKGIYKLLVKKPVCATQDEKKNNPRARSAKLRAAEKI